MAIVCQLNRKSELSHQTFIEPSCELTQLVATLVKCPCSPRESLLRPISDSKFFVYESQCKYKKSTLFFSKHVYRFATHCSIQYLGVWLFATR